MELLGLMFVANNLLVEWMVQSILWLGLSPMIMHQSDALAQEC